MAERVYRATKVSQPELDDQFGLYFHFAAVHKDMALLQVAWYQRHGMDCAAGGVGHWVHIHASLREDVR